MLKHATINRTSRAQQTLQLQLQCQRHQQDQLPMTKSDTDERPDTHPLSLDSSLGDKLLNPSTTSGDQLMDSHLLDQQKFRNLADELLTARSNSNLLSTPSPQPLISGSPVPSPSLLLTPTKFRLASNSSLMSSPSSLLRSPQQQLNGGTNRSSAKSADSMIKVFAQTLSQDVEYITLHVNSQTKSSQIIKSLLKKFRLKHRDPNLFYLTLERWIRKDGLKFKSVMLLGDEACPLQLQQCCSNPPHNDIKFTLQIRAGALVKIFCSDIVPDARYKCLSLSTQTTVEETIELMLHCLNLNTVNTSLINNHHHQRQSNSPASTSSATSSSNSSSSGIESEPNCRNNKHHVTSSLSKNHHHHQHSLSTLMTTSTTNDHHNQRMLDSDSRASSVTSISSTSNISNLSSSLTDQYCLIIECKDTNYKRILDPDEYLVDVYQNLLQEAKGQANESSVTDNVTNGNTNHNNNDSIKHLDQWFFIKLKRRDDFEHPTIKFTNPRQNVPLPPIPLSLSAQFNTANNLQQFVSTTQIEVNRCRPGSSLALTSDFGSNSSALLLEHNINYVSGESNNKMSVTSDCGGNKLIGLASNGTNNAANVQPLDEIDSTRQPPPPAFILLPPIRPRRRNLSNASSTFGRPLIVPNNRRRYDPAQLAEDLNRLDVTKLEIVADGNCQRQM